MITAAVLNDLPGIRHAFFTREGGVSEGVHASLNCGFGSDDTPANVAENRARAMTALDQSPDALVTAYQVHSATAVTVDDPWPEDARPKADALVTDRPGVVLGVLTADCVPVLLADARAGVIAAAHAGWRGAKAGILEATVARMAERGAQAERTVAVAGPCIRQRSYEVDSAFRDAFLAEAHENDDLFAPARAEGKFLFDLPRYVHGRLTNLGLGIVQILPGDTHAEPDRFFSHRRATREGATDCGRALAAIVRGPTRRR